jgi:hypothetical protein
MAVGLTADGASLLKRHRDVLKRLPVSFRAFLALEAEKWPTFFEPERTRLAATFEALAAVPPGEALVAVARLEREAGCEGVRETDARQLQEATQSLLRRSGLQPAWRQEVDRVFQVLQPEIDRRLYPAEPPRRVVVVLYGRGIAIQRAKLWARLRTVGLRIPLRLDGAVAPEPFLRGLFGAAEATLFSALGAPESVWTLDAGDALHELAESGPRAPATALSYTRLQGYREALARALYQRVTAGVSGPQELAAYARALDAAPPPGTLRAADPRVRAFARDVLLGGNGALLVNNTFVEWAAVQALRRAEPRLLVARFGVRDKMKPFSSLLLFASARPTDQVPVVEDPFGSFVDVEQLAYYVWLQAEKSAAYRGRTLYLFLAEGLDELLAIRSDVEAPSSLPAAPVALGDVRATMAEWLGVPMDSGGAAIAPLTPGRDHGGVSRITRLQG